MKSINVLMVCAMLLTGTCGVVNAQNHRHTQRNDSLEKSVTAESVVENSKKNAKTASENLAKAANDMAENASKLAESAAAVAVGKAAGTVDTTVENQAKDFDSMIEEKVEKHVEEMVNNAVDDALDGNIDIDADDDFYDAEQMANHVTTNVRWIAAIAICAILAVFCGPAIFIGVILLFVYKRKKSRDAVVMEAIRNGKEVPAGYGSSSKYTRNANAGYSANASSNNGNSTNTSSNVNNGYSANTAYNANSNYSTNANTNSAKSGSGIDYSRFTDEPMMHQGIMKVVIGLGLAVLSSYIDLSLLTGIGWFIIIYGLGKILIAYLSKGPEPEARQTTSAYVKDEAKAEPKQAKASEAKEDQVKEDQKAEAKNEDEKPE